MSEEYFTNAVKAICNLKELLGKNDEIKVGKSLITKKTLYRYNESLFFQMKSFINNKKEFEPVKNLVNLGVVTDIYEKSKKEEEDKKRKEVLGDENYEYFLKFLEGNLIVTFRNTCYYYNGIALRGITSNGEDISYLTDKNSVYFKFSFIFDKDNKLKVYEVNVEKDVEKLKGKFFNSHKDYKFFYAKSGKIICSDYTVRTKDYLTLLFLHALRNNKFDTDLVIKNCCK